MHVERTEAEGNEVESSADGRPGQEMGLRALALHSGKQALLQSSRAGLILSRRRGRSKQRSVLSCNSERGVDGSARRAQRCSFFTHGSDQVITKTALLYTGTRKHTPAPSALRSDVTLPVARSR
jgi:hypothetical protein